MKNIILQTERLNISIPSMDSLDNWYKLQSDKDVMKYIADGSPRDKDGAKLSLQKSIKHFEDHGFCLFDISLKETGEFIGEAGLIYLAFDQKNEDVEVGYTLHKKHWSKGYATELAETFIKWGFDNFHFSRIVACCERDNIASSNVMKKCGMNYQGKYLYNGKNECDIYHINNIVIKTDNFYLRPFHEKDDFDLSYNLWNDEDVLKSMECPACTKEDIKEKLARYKLWMDKFGFTNFAVFTKDSDDFVGSCGMSLFHDPDNDRNPLQVINSDKYLNRDVEIGYVLHKKYWGKGYATELAKACVNFVFSADCNIKRIVAVTVPSNMASQNVLSKIGFKFEKEVSSGEYGKENFFALRRNDSNVCILYDKVSDWYDKNRLQNIDDKKPYLNFILSKIKSSASILDIGCGTGEPIAKFFIEKGYNVTGIDGAKNMIGKCKDRYPNANWILQDMRKLDLGKKFNAIVIWDSLFHLSYADQSLQFSIIENHADDNCILLFNTGVKHGEIYSEWAEQNFYHASLDLEEYRSLLAKHGFKVIKESPDDVDMVVWVCVYNKSCNQNIAEFGLPAEYQQIPEYFDKHNICDDTELKNSVVEKLLDKQNVKNILDMTCGTGSQVFYLTKKGYKITGSDFSPELIKLARKKAKKQNLDIEFIDGDMRLLKVGSFDAVITMFNAIGHLSKKDFAKALKNISVNLSEKGIYIFDIFNLNAMSDKVVEDLKMDQKFEVNSDKINQIQYSKLDRKNAILTSYDNYKIEDRSGKIRKINNEFSLQIYCAKELKETLEENGFKILKFYDIYGKEFIEDKSLNIMVVAQKI